MSIWLQPEPQNWWQFVEDALWEDVGNGDVSGGVLPEDLMVRWKIEAQAEGVVCGLGIVEFLFAPYNNEPEPASVEIHLVDGDRVSRGDTVASGYLGARRVVQNERTALNFLMLLSGVSTLTDQFVRKVEGTKATIIDTRKTIPMLRALQKYAVRCGGGGNHRMGLFDAAMLKDNHIAAASSITGAVKAFRSYASHMLRLEVECETLEQVDEAVAAGVDVVLLDNMDPFEMRKAVKKYEGRCLFEASGGINLDTVRGVAQTGVDYISVGALTHSAVSLSFHMELE